MSCTYGRVIGLSLCVAATWSLTGAGCLPTVGGGGGAVGSGSLTNLPPVAIITSSVVGGISPLTVEFSSDRSTDDGVIVNRAWDFGDGGTSLEISPRHTFDSNGTFTVTLTLTDNAGATSTTTLPIEVTDAPFALITVDRTSATSAPATINFSAGASFDPDGEIQRILWDFGDGATEIIEETPHTFTSAGTFRVRLTVTDDVGISSRDEVLINIGIADPRLELRIPTSDLTNVVVPQDGTLWVQGVYDVEPGTPRTVRAGVDEDLDPFNGNDIQLDSRGVNGNDLNLLAVTDLQLSSVAVLGGLSVPVGDYRLWAEIDTDRSDPIRSYAPASVTVTDPFTGTITNRTPVIPLIDDQATVLVRPDQPRQIFDVGPVSAGDRIRLQLVSPPDFTGFFAPDTGEAFSLMLLDADREIVAWYQQSEDESFVLYNEATRLVISEDSPRLFVVMDGGYGVDVAIDRGTNLGEPSGQRILLDFAGTGGRFVAVGGLPARAIPSLAQSLSGLTPGQVEEARDACVARVQALYAPYDVEIVTSDQVAADPNLALEVPFLRLYVGGRDFGRGLFGIADYIDPRNDTVSGAGIAYAQTIAEDVGGSPTNIGIALGNVAAHEIGHLLGLRHTDSVTDIMSLNSAIDDNTVNFESTLVSEFEQFGTLPAIGIQNAPELLRSTVGD